MEVKIKNSDGSYSAAEWTIENGVMVVSPKEVKFVPKNGDVCKIMSCIYIFKNIKQTSLRNNADMVVYHCCYNETYNRLSIGEDVGVGYLNKNHRPATEEEKKKLFDKLKEEGYEFDFEKKELVKLKWKPNEGEHYFSPIFSNIDFLFSTCSHICTGHFTDEMTIKKMRAFRTKDECQLFCDKLNQTIEEYEP